VLPLLYVDVPALHDETVEDDLIKLVRTFQRKDWRQLCYAEVMSEAYRRGVADLANRLVEANRRAEEVDVTAKALQIRETPDGIIDESPGLIDQLARAEETLPKWQETVEAVGREIELIGRVMQEAAADIRRSNAQGKGFASRLLIAREIARRLVEPADRIQSFGNEYASQLHDVDEGFRAIIERAPEEIRTNPTSKADVCAFFETVRHLSGTASKALENVQMMIEAIAPIEKMSRDMRPALRRLRQGLTIMVEAREVSDEWVRLIDGSGIRCEDQAVETS
jgi:hypothetical protein